ncbi:hypothetical protein [Methylibium sp.]|uniref:hypothetical protein n=1 Tax=Methylibium sp. TaxID=2067992 RepID=UPI003D113976
MRTRHYFCCLVAAALSACGGSNDTAPPVAITPATPASAATVVLDRSQTVSGTDSNNNGIRDDIDSLVDSYPLSAPQKKASSQLASAIQTALLTSGTLDPAYANAQEMHRAQLCMNSLISGYTTYSRDIEAKTLNTEPRIKAWIAFETAIAGQVFPTPQGGICK